MIKKPEGNYVNLLRTSGKVRAEVTGRLSSMFTVEVGDKLTFLFYKDYGITWENINENV